MREQIRFPYELRTVSFIFVLESDDHNHMCKLTDHPSDVIVNLAWPKHRIQDEYLQALLPDPKISG